jgi:YfiH family protein
MEWRERGGVCWLEARMPGATAAFTTRPGGVSKAPFEALNLGLFTDDDRDDVVENRRRLAAALGFPPDRIAAAHQVHGAELIEHAGTPARRCSFASCGPEEEQGGGLSDELVARLGAGSGGLAKADGHVVTVSQVAALVFVADCVPVALAGPGGVAMLHCGWRGLAAGIIAKGVAATDATDAAIGPSIGPCCYEVGPEVQSALQPPTEPKVAHLTTISPVGGMVDLPAVAEEQLREAGVEQVETSGLCTSCAPDLFFSHRRDRGRTGRQAGLVWRSTGEG